VHGALAMALALQRTPASTQRTLVMPQASADESALVGGLAVRGAITCSTSSAPSCPATAQTRAACTSRERLRAARRRASTISSTCVARARPSARSRSLPPGS